MNFDRFFKLISYAVVFCGFLALVVAGGAGLLAGVLFPLILIAAWFLENSRRQLSERLGTALIFIVVPLFYIGWKYQIIGIAAGSSAVVGMLARMILILAAIKLLQKKADRDWLFLYLMAFFEVLLAAGLSISPLYLGALILYLLATVCAIVAFEIRKTSRTIGGKTIVGKLEKPRDKFAEISVARLPLTAISLLVLIIALGTPLFFALPRVGGAGFGGGANEASNITGFSDSVNLGEIGQLLQSDQIVMRARLEKTHGKNPQLLKWRGIALDTFDNKKWSKSNPDYLEPYIKSERDFFLIDYASDQDDLIIQTVYLEPINPPTLFAVSRPVAVEGNFYQISKDSEGALSFRRRAANIRNSDDDSVFQSEGSDRVSYKVYSDVNLPSVGELKADAEKYPPVAASYLQLPEEMDGRISDLSAKITASSYNRYDKAKAVEKYLQTQFAYSLDMRATGEQPLADFLFNVRAGHCEYFASAMAIMLRTQGIATRLVNGFQQGEYNGTADVYVVRQKDAHSWVEVYFPTENAWIPFDPTPFAEQNREANGATAGVYKKFNSYLEALETFWIQYFVSYDNQEQRSLARSFRNSFNEYQSSTSIRLKQFEAQISDWWKQVRGDQGLQASAAALGYGIGYLLAAILGIFFIVWLFRKIAKLEIWRKIFRWLKRRNETTIIEFYERMQTILANQGFARAANQTPLEFAFALEMPEVIKITEKYHRVRFGEKTLSPAEASEIENWLKNLEK
ncbi:MAG: DUF3488 and transglutaminase-like domain-containing protein [Acidobacteriota bacterium]|nr:DUF3488 and transglutaminase-like domain-containing protein [Acidobacteriota bacterium]